MKMKKTFVIPVLMALAGCSTVRSTDDLPVVGNFDAARYMGVWHEIARLPQGFERGLTSVTAEYRLENGGLRITNRGLRKGELKVATAVGHFAGPATEGAFRVSFFRPFYGDYRIIWLSPDYDLALVTGNDRSYLWILSRSAVLAPERLKKLVDQAKEWGFDVSKLEYPGA
jgi:apolipoprotein D and lipocalin family protein